MKHKDKSKEDLIAELKKSENIISNLKSRLDSQNNVKNLSDCHIEIQKLKKSLKDSENKYNDIFENIQDIFYKTNENGILTEISPSAEKYSGYKVEELIGKSADIFYANPDDRKRLLRTIKEKGEVFDFEILLKSKDGKLIHTSINARIIFDSNNQPIGIEGYLRDISSRKKAENQLLATQNRLQVAMDLAKIGSWEYDVESDLFTFDDQFYSLYGTTLEEQGGSQMSSQDYASKFLPPEEASVVAEEIERFLNTDDSIYSNILEHTIIRADGEKRFIVVSNHALKNENGKTVKVYGANQDITERKQAEEALKKSEEKYRKIFDNIQDVFYQTDINGQIIEISPAIKRYSGFSREELIGQQVENVYLNPEDRPKMLKLILDNGEISDYELKLKNINGELVYASVNAHFLFDSNNQPIGIEGSLRDITQRKITEKALEESEGRFRTIFENTGAATIIFNKEGIITLANKEMTKLFEYSSEEIENKKKWTEFVYPDDLSKMINYHNKREKNPASAPNSYETRFVDRHGMVHDTKITVDKIPDTDDYVTSVLDITDLKNAYRELESSENRFRSLFENNPVPYQSLDLDGKYIDLNEQLSELLGYSREEILGKSFSDFWTSETIDEFPQKFEYLKDHGWANNVEINLVCKNGDIKTVLLTGRTQKDPITGQFLRTHGILYDISERKLMEDKLKKSLEEKDLLIKEIHHRVKNNLMVISSLLNLQSNLIKDKEAKNIFRESQSRAKSMAMIHERLYSSDDLKRIDFGDYIRTLSTELFHTYVLDPSIINLKLNVEKIMIDINTAVPLGLIVNELVSNAMKYAFPAGRPGEIDISFHQIDDKYVLIVKDDGVGIPSDLDINKVKSLGLQLVTNLSNQIDGVLKLNRENGTNFEITFKEVEY